MSIYKANKNKSEAQFTTDLMLNDEIKKKLKRTYKTTRVNLS
jgi:hypothetical protein